jgi:hypothetical protein
MHLLKKDMYFPLGVTDCRGKLLRPNISAGIRVLSDARLRGFIEVGNVA